MGQPYIFIAHRLQRQTHTHKHTEPEKLTIIDELQMLNGHFIYYY